MNRENAKSGFVFLFLRKQVSMKRVVIEKQMTEKEYIEFELNADLRHEYINGKLFEMPGESTANNDFAGNLYVILKPALKTIGYSVYTHDVKLKIPQEPVYFYPDLFVSKEKPSSDEYIVRSAVLVAEVLSKSTRHFDMFDKYLQYRKLPELRYYLLIESKTHLVTLLEKDEDGEWATELYNNDEEWVDLKELGIKFQVKDLYE